MPPPLGLLKNNDLALRARSLFLRRPRGSGIILYIFCNFCRCGISRYISFPFWRLLYTLDRSENELRPVGLVAVRVRTGHGKPGKSWNLSISASRPLKSWNLIVAHGKSCKIIVCVVRKLLQVPKWQASYVRKYPKSRLILTIFESDS